MGELFLPGVPGDQLDKAYAAAPGNEIASGKFANPELSAALVANTFGFFIDRPGDLPPIPRTEAWGWPAASVTLEACVHFPWAGGRHPYLDALIETKAALIGIESKRYEPFRRKQEAVLSQAYWQPVWGTKMRRYESVRDQLRDNPTVFNHLNACQLVKHAFGLRTAVNKRGNHRGKRAILVYLYAEPAIWPDGRPIPPMELEWHATEIERFAVSVRGDEVEFCATSYSKLLSSWQESPLFDVRGHAKAVAERFNPSGAR